MKGYFKDKPATRIVLKITDLHYLGGRLIKRWSQEKLVGPY